MASEKQYTVFGDVVEVLASSATTNGAYSVFTQVARPGGGPPPHIHQFEDEFFIPLSGEFEMFDGETWSPVPSQGAFGPRGKVHTWRNCGTTEGTLLFMATGDNFDVFLEKLEPIQIPQDLDRLIAISAEHGISYVLPGLPAPEVEATKGSIPAGEASFDTIGGSTADLLVSSAATNGAFSLLVGNVPPGDGPPPHVHTMEDEFFLPLEGQFEIFNGENWLPLGPQGLFAPRNRPHTFRNVGKSTGRLLAIADGSNFDQFLPKLAPLQLPRDMAQMIAISAQHGITYLLPGAPQPVQVEEGELLAA